MSVSPPCYGALALEVAAAPARLHLDRADAAALAQHVATDLARLLPGVESLDLALLGAHYDPTELLRPGWPLHAALTDLAARAPGAGPGRVIAFGAAEETLPASLPTPDAGLQGGPLRLLPFVLRGDAERLATVGRAMEDTLLETGMAGAATALFAQDAFAARIEHARYLSLQDLCAMTAMQYEHAGLAALWPLIETALFAPNEECWLDAPPEPLLRYAAGEARLAALADAPRAVVARARQIAAVLDAHAIALHRIEIGAGDDPRERLRA